MNRISARSIVICAFLVLGIAGLVGFSVQSNLADSTNGEQAASLSESSKEPILKPEDTRAQIDVAASDKPQSVETLPTDVTAASLEEDFVEGVDDGGAENAQQVFNTAQLSDTEEQIDFQMMNPELINGETEVAQSFEIVTSEVNWDEARQHPLLPESLLSIEQTEVVEQSPIPVMLPLNATQFGLPHRASLSIVHVQFCRADPNNSYEVL